ncbi:hypothetical protein E1B28_012469 [Marasmius oreades]|uniref:Uncharacterized protein n=1 Tax=Marasmius oreades TaxID=181124 RepID=A0A9P7RSC9_9AGAR|nr:uncharacterized protein E1B28_012469 [Marasmius oreades]KAG7088480.1 hypothetical protein E1B28_012469 [Marasmius oreades]
MNNSSSTLGTATTDATSSPTQPTSHSNSSNLYLFTFVATLFVLLLISSTIIFRSYILRRRYQRNLQEALASGVILTPREQGSRRKRFRTRPKFYDVWLDPTGDTWEDMMPVSVLPVKPKRRRKVSHIDNRAQRRGPSITERFVNALSMGRNRIFRLPAAPSPQAPQEDLESSQLAAASVPISCAPPEPEKGPTTTIYTPSVPIQFQVAVLVQMPSPRNIRYREDISCTDRSEDAELPEVVFGVTRLVCKPDTPASASE